MEFLQIAWEHKRINIDQLRFLTRTEKQPWGQITPDEFEIITGVKF